MVNKTLAFLVVGLPAVSVLVLLYVGLPFLNQISEQNKMQENNTLMAKQQFDNAVSQAVSTCVESPSTNCDDEMARIMEFCKQNKDQNPPICADERVWLYLSHRGINATVNGAP